MVSNKKLNCNKKFNMLIEKLNLSKKVKDKNSHHVFVKNIQNLKEEIEFSIEGKLEKSEDFQYLLNYFTDNNNWQKKYAQASKIDHQKSLLNISLNELKMPRKIFKRLLLHLREEPLEDV